MVFTLLVKDSSIWRISLFSNLSAIEKAKFFLGCAVGDLLCT